MDISKFNLNLLRSLDALISEQNVTRAAERLNITQSAMSSSLNQLRSVFNDDLLVRCQHGMLLTPRAQELSRKIKPIMHKINALTQNQYQFDPATSDRTFCLAMTDFACLVFLEPLLAHLKKEAPNVRITVRPLDNSVDQTTLLADPKNELYLGYASTTPKNFQQQHVLEISSVCVANKNHPLMQKKMTMADYLNAEHLAVAVAGHGGFSDTDAYLQIMGKKRKIRLSVPHALNAVDILPETDLIATLPIQSLDAFFDTSQVKYQPIPFTFPLGQLNQIWHQRFEHDQGHTWLRETIYQIGVQSKAKVNKHG